MYRSSGLWKFSLVSPGIPHTVRLRTLLTLVARRLSPLPVASAFAIVATRSPSVIVARTMEWHPLL